MRKFLIGLGTAIGLILVLAPLPTIAQSSMEPTTRARNTVGNQPSFTPQYSCNNSAIYDASTNGSTQLVALSSGQRIYVCGFTFFSAGTVNLKLISGTGTACATGSSNLTPAFQFTAQTGLVDPSPYYRGLATPVNGALCINASGAVAAQAIVYYNRY